MVDRTAPRDRAAPSSGFRGPVGDRVRDAIGQVPRNLLTPGVCKPLADLDAPVGCLSPIEQAPPCPSRSAAALVLEALDPGPGDRVLVQGRAVGWLGLILARLVEDGTVRIEEEHESLRARWRSTRPFRRQDSVRLADAGEPSKPGVDKVLAWAPGRQAARRLPRRLDEEGTVLLAHPDPEEPELARIVRQGDAETTLDLTEQVPRPRGVEVEAAPSAGDVLRQEAVLAVAWTGDRPEGLAREIGLSVDETIGEGLAGQGLVRQAPERAAAARVAFHLAYTHQMLGNLEPAAEAYSASIEVLPTAEAYTFRGWVRSQQDRLEEAIEDCRRAIDEDPTLGNPYNDIGAYRLEQGRPSEALEWFRKAVEAERYSSPEFPYLNMARAHLMLDEEDQARQALEEALDVRPGFEPARRLLDRIDGPADEFGT